jgi:hypothetical protein
LNRIHVANDNCEPLPFGHFIPDYDLPTLNLKNMPPKNPPL